MASSRDTWLLTVSRYCARYCEGPSKVEGMGADKFSEKVKLITPMKQLRASDSEILHSEVESARLRGTDNRATGA